jgi:hypothetical protein
MNVITSSHNPVAHLSTENLNARAREAAATIVQAGLCLGDPEALAFEAARLGCAHLGHIETLERVARRAGLVA